MKKLILSFTFCLALLGAFAQSDKYMKAMQDKVAALDSTHDVDGMKNLSASFERIADAEKTQWLPYYYAAYTEIQAALFASTFQQAKGDVTDPMADKAEALLNKAEALSKENSEIYIVRKMIASTRMMADPMNRYRTYGAQAATALETARKLNPDNPRIYLLQAEDKFYTPEQYGGSKTEAKKLFDLSQQKYDAFKPATTIDPDWGRSALQYFLSQYK